MTEVLVSPCGEGAVRVTVHDDDVEERWRTVHRIADWLDANPVSGIHGWIPTYDSLLIDFDPFRASADSLAPVVRHAADTGTGTVSGRRRFVLPVVYGGHRGPDLGFVAGYLGITEDEVIALHAGVDRVVRCLGGPAATCMLDGPAFSAPVPRLADPRLEVPANAVSLAGAQANIGTVKAPSGWRLIGLTPVNIIDPRSEDLVPYRPGDVVRFTAIHESDWDSYSDTYLHELAEPC